MHWLPVLVLLAATVSIIECNRIINTNTRITKIRLIAGRSRNLRLKQIISCCGRYRCNGLLRKKNGGRHSRNRTKKRTKKPGGASGTTIADEVATEAASDKETTAAAGDGETTEAAGEQTTAAAEGGETTAGEGETTPAAEGETTAAEGETTTVAAENSTLPSGGNATLANSTLLLSNQTTNANATTSMLNSKTTSIASNFTVTMAVNATISALTTLIENITTTTSNSITTTTTPPPCLPYQCAKDKSLLDANEFINQSLVDGYYRTSCGNTYFFSKAMKLWSEAAAECCKMNMRLLSIESLDEQMCLAKMLKGNGNEAIGDVHWTSASDEFHEGTFTWCANSSSPLNLISDLKYFVGEPNNAGGDEDCLGAKITTDSAPANFLLSDNGCSKPAKFICETYAKPCPLPICPNVSNATDAMKMDESKKWKSNSDGVFRRACDRQYFFSKSLKTNADAQTECYKYGLTLLSIESPQELKCLAEMNAGRPRR